MDVDDLKNFIVSNDSNTTIEELEDWTTEELEEFALNLGMDFEDNIC